MNINMRHLTVKQEISVLKKSIKKWEQKLSKPLSGISENFIYKRIKIEKNRLKILERKIK